MDERILAAVEGDEAYCVGGAIRDELLGRPVLDTDVACREPEAAAQRLGGLTKSAAFLLSERHGAWRVAFRDGRTVDFTLLKGDIQADLGGRDFTVNAIAVPLPAGEPIDPFGGRSDLESHRLRAVYDRAFTDDPLRLLRAARLEDELELRIDPATEELIRRDAHLVAEPAGERVLAELLRLSDAGWRRLDELGLLAGLGGSIARLGVVEPGASAELRLVAALGDAVFALPLSNELRRFARKLLAARRRRTILPARSTASGGRPSRGRSRRWRSWTRAGWRPPSSARVRRSRPSRSCTATSSVWSRAPRSAGCWSG